MFLISHWLFLCTEVKQNDENVSPLAVDLQTIEIKTRKAFVPPLLQNAGAQQTNGVKRSGYFSGPAPSKLHPTGPGIFSEHHRKRKTDESTSTNTEGVDLADHTESYNDVINCPDVHKVLQNNLLFYS